MLTKIKDPGSAITHFTGMIISTIVSFPLLIRASGSGLKNVICMYVFILSMIFLYMASTAYHTFDISLKVNTILQKIDHIMISVLIAGTYTPLCLILLNGRKALIMFIIIWSLALANTTLNIFYIHCPKWLSSIIYIIMGWICVFCFPAITKAASSGFVFLLIGGLFYTLGGIIYALKPKKFNQKFKNFGTHEVFHVFVMLGSVMHYIFMYVYVASI